MHIQIYMPDCLSSTQCDIILTTHTIVLNQIIRSRSELIALCLFLHLQMQKRRENTICYFLTSASCNYYFHSTFPHYPSFPSSHSSSLSVISSFFSLFIFRLSEFFVQFFKKGKAFQEFKKLKIFVSFGADISEGLSQRIRSKSKTVMPQLFPRLSDIEETVTIQKDGLNSRRLW